MGAVKFEKEEADDIVAELIPAELVNPEWVSSHEYRSANTYSGIGPRAVNH